MLDINHGYKRWLLGGIIEKVNEDKKIYETDDMEKVTSMLNDYHNVLTESKPPLSFSELQSMLTIKAKEIIEAVYSLKKEYICSSIKPK